MEMSAQTRLLLPPTLSLVCSDAAMEEEKWADTSFLSNMNVANG